jgi:hypothetical protein
MLVPVVLAAPALTAGLSLWFDWGPQWTALAIVLAVALLALFLDYRRALRYGLVGAGAGLITCPLLLLLGSPAWYLFVTWIGTAMVLPALLVPLLFDPPQLSRTEQPPKQSIERSTGRLTQTDTETLEQLAAVPRVGHD